MLAVLWSATLQIGAYLAALRMKGETADEIVGSIRAMRTHVLRIPTQRTGLIDVVGTGGDHSNTFNISTTTAFVVAGAGVPVAKHGNKAASSQSGSADVLNALESLDGSLLLSTLQSVAPPRCRGEPLLDEVDFLLRGGNTFPRLLLKSAARKSRHENGSYRRPGRCPSHAMLRSQAQRGFRNL